MKLLFIIIFSAFLFTNVISAQQEVTYNNKTFKKSQVVKAAIGNRGETFSFFISEHDMSPNGPWAKELQRLENLGEIANPKDAPRGLILSLSVDFKNGFSFPIKPTDSVVLSLSNIKNELTRKMHIESQVSNIDTKKTKEEGKTLHTKKLSVEAETKKIAKLMQEGKISPDDAMKQIEALTKPMLAAVENSYSFNMAPEDHKDRSCYYISLDDSLEGIEANIITGNLHIVEFNKHRLVAYISGKHIVECTDVKRINSPTKVCKQVDSQLIPGLQVLREGNVYLSINSKFNTFNDFRN